MIRIRSVLVTFAGSVALAAPAMAQDACGFKTFASARKAGSFAEYKLTGTQNDGALRLTALGVEKKDGAALERVEMQVPSPRGQAVMQLLVPTWPFDMTQAADVIVQIAGQPPMRMPPQMLAMMAQRGGGSSITTAVQKACNEAKLVGSEKVTVAAGSFDTKHYQNAAEGSDVWISTEVGGWGLVKAVSKTSNLELLGLGKDGKSALTGEVMDMPSMGGMPKKP